jgi:hypothetical protein
MTDFNQALRQTETPDSVPTHNQPNAFQDLAASIWGPPGRNADQSGGAPNVERTAFGGGQQQQFGGHIPEIPGVLTKLEGVTDAPKTEVTVQAKVAKILPDFDNPRNGLKHEQFIIEMADGTDVFVAHDLNFAPKVPLQVGEDIKLKGEWIPTNENHGGVDTIGVLHWTHHSESEAKHPSGYIEAGGQHYE